MRAIKTAAVLLLATGARAQLYHIEQFEGTNAAAWTFGAPVETLEPSGGFAYCCGYLRGSGLTTGLPIVRTSSAGTPFTGDYRASHITEVMAALTVRQAELPFATQRATVILRSFNGTPADPTDDWGAYLVGYPHQTLGPLQTWRLFSFIVPSHQTVIPFGWLIIRFGPGAPAAPDWNALVQGVDSLAFAFGDPSLSYPVQNWEVGVDYAVIDDLPIWYANCDNSTVSPCLNVLDFVCFLNLFAAGDLRANCDGSAVPPVLNVSDFGCFLMQFAAGNGGC